VKRKVGKDTGRKRTAKKERKKKLRARREGKKDNGFTYLWTP
jgi:hypothetical protein